MTDSTPEDRVRRALVKVGAGRGFVMEVGSERTGRVIVTAAHCLPRLPPANAASYPEERTYHDLIGPLDGESTISCECIFCDPVADVAVVSNPDSEEFPPEYDAFEQFIVATESLKLSAHPEHAELPAWLIDLDGHWVSCRAHLNSKGMSLTEVVDDIQGGMSGSPIVTVEGAAVGVVGQGTRHGQGMDGPQARLPHRLPAWLVGFEAKKPSGIS